MMVRIDNRQIRFQNGFAGRAARQAYLRCGSAYFARFSIALRERLRPELAAAAPGQVALEPRKPKSAGARTGIINVQVTEFYDCKLIGFFHDYLRQAVERLTEVQRQVRIRRRWEGMTFAEIGRRLARREDAVRMVFRRALDRLAEEVECESINRSGHSG